MHHFKNCRAEINDTFVDYADFINITVSMYNLIEYSDNYSGTSGSLWNFKTDEIDNNASVTNDNNDPSFKYKANPIVILKQMEQKKCKNSYTTKIFKQFLEIIRNTID